MYDHDSSGPARRRPGLPAGTVHLIMHSWTFIIREVRGIAIVIELESHSHPGLSGPSQPFPAGSSRSYRRAASRVSSGCFKFPRHLRITAATGQCCCRLRRPLPKCCSPQAN